MHVVEKEKKEDRRRKRTGMRGVAGYVYRLVISISYV
jgi:hypothetical protein